MHINRHPANIFGNHIKQNSAQFDQFISELVNRFINELNLDLPHQDIANLGIIYKFIFMYGLITSNFSIIPSIMRHSMAIMTVVNALIINGSLKIRQHLDLVNTMLIFGKSNRDVLNNQIMITRCCINFNADSFYKTIRLLVSKYCNHNL